MANNEEIPDTQPATQDAMTIDTPFLSQPVEPPSYGRLVGKHVKIKSLDLNQPEFSVGRNKDCHLTVGAENFPPSKLGRISKVHFTIQKDLTDLWTPTYIIDGSSNGTFVNGRLIGTKNKMILRHKDIISLSYANLRSFVYHDLRQRDSLEITAKEVLERYHIGQKIGSGACGTVYLVHDPITCESYALKHVTKCELNERTRPQFLNDPQRVMNEVNIMKSLDHPCVIKMHDIVDEPNSVCMILEYMKGGDLLSRILTTDYLPEKTAKLFFFQMCHAVKYLHEQGITHRDLKPDNILLQDNNEYTLLKVSDFGLSKFVSKNTALRTICGTPLYVAPEVLKTGGRGSYTRKVDIWSLGVVLFTMLSGSLPFSDDYGTPAVEQIKRGTFHLRHDAWRQVSAPAKKLIREILSIHPSTRPSIDDLLRSSWLRDPEIIAQAQRLMKISPNKRTFRATTASDVENNNSAHSSRSLEQPRKRSRL